MTIYNATLTSKRRVQLADLSKIDLFDIPEFKEMEDYVRGMSDGLSKEDTREVARVFVGFALAYMDDAPMEEVVPLILARLRDLSTGGKEWATRFISGMVNKLMRPAYDAALAAGADPVRSVAAQAVVLYPAKEFPVEEIEKIVALFKEQDEKKAAKS